MKLQIVFFLFVNILVSQNRENNYLPSNIDSLEYYLERINNKFTDNIEGEFSSEIKKIYKNQDKKIIKSIKDSAYFFNAKIKKNLDNILKTIYEANPDIETKDFNFFIKNNIVPNATCYGNGMYEIYLGLFTTLESDDELASVICHELAHYLLEHSLKSVSKRIALINSKETKNKIKDLKKQKYGQTRAALSVIDELSINILERSKKVESEADSLGFILFSKTKYNTTHSISSLNKLKDVDDMIFHHDVKLDSTFNFKNFKFKSYWLKKNTSIFDTEEEINEFKLASDTIKTHPEVPFRVKKLINDFNISEVIELGRDDNIKELKKLAHMQGVNYVMDTKQLDLAMYQLIQKFNKNLIDKEFYYVSMAKILKITYEAKKNHKLGLYVPPSNNFSDEKNLNIIRLFLNNIELFETKKLGVEFCKSAPAEIIVNKEFNSINNFFIKNN